jgi:uncharacterized membrane protein
MLDAKRVLRHLSTPARRADRAFPPAVRTAVEAAVAEIERARDVFLKVLLEPSLPLAAVLRGRTARQRAVELFAAHHVWDTEYNCGVLVYVLLADKKIEIVADRGISAKVAQEEWDAICRRIAAEFREGRFEAGAMLGVNAITSLLAAHVPPRPRPD